MPFKRPSPEQTRVLLGALEYLALCDSLELTPAERDMLEAIQQVFGTDHEIDWIKPLGPAEVARRVTDPDIRLQIIRTLVVASLVDGQANEVEVGLIDAFAWALDVGAPTIARLRQLVHHETMALRFDLVRRFWAIDEPRARPHQHGVGAALRFVRAATGSYEDPGLARRFSAWRSLPSGTLGREYVRFADDNGWPLPGEKGAASDILVCHDMTHLLSAYGTDPAGEVQTACFAAGYRKQDPFTFILFALLQFQVGFRLTPIAVDDRDLFDAESATRAFLRGASMNIDLSDGWDYWDVADVPVEDLRRRYGIRPESRSPFLVGRRNGATPRPGAR